MTNKVYFFIFIIQLYFAVNEAQETTALAATDAPITTTEKSLLTQNKVIIRK